MLKIGTGIEAAGAARSSVAGILAAMRKLPTSAKLWFCRQARQSHEWIRDLHQWTAKAIGWWNQLSRRVLSSVRMLGTSS